MKKIITFLVLTGSILFISACSSRKAAHFGRINPVQHDYKKNRQVNHIPDSYTDAATIHTALDQPVTSERESSETVFAPLPVQSALQPTVISQPEKYEQTLKKDKISKKDLKRSVKQASQANYTVFMTILLVVLAIILPPVAVLLVDGLRGPFWLSILLTILFYLPGIIYAFFRIFKTR